MSSKECDFYYSEEQFKMCKKLEKDGAKWGDGTPFKFKRMTFKGKEFTESVERGQEPCARFDDYVFIGTGIYDNVRVKGN